MEGQITTTVTPVLKEAALYITGIAAPVVIQFLKRADKIPVPPSGWGAYLSQAVAIVCGLGVAWSGGHLTEFDWASVTSLIQGVVGYALVFGLQKMTYHLPGVGVKALYGTGTGTPQ